MKRLIALTMALGMICGCTACNEKSKETAVPVTESAELVLNAADIKLGDNFKRVKCLSHDPLSGNIMTFGELKNGNLAGFISKNDFGDYTQFDFTLQEGEIFYNAALLTGGRKAVLTLYEGKTLIHIYDSNNKLAETIDCGEIIEADCSYIPRIYCNGEDGYIINMGNTQLIAISSDGKNLGEIKTNGMTICGVENDSENKLNILLDDMNNIHSCTIDLSSLSAITSQKYKSTGSSAYAVGTGAGKYKYIGAFHNGIYGFTDTEIVMLAEFFDLPFDNYQVRDMFMLSESEFVVNVFEDTGEKMYLLTEADISELKSKEVITIMSYVQSGGIFDEEIKKFNAENEDYRAEYKNYFSEESMSFEADRLRMDMISGNAPDIILFNSLLPIDTFNTEIFCDLYEFIDNDPDISREDFIPNVREGMERDGRLVMIAPNFSFSTILAKSGYEGIRENWSVDDMITAYENTPEGMEFFTDEEINPRDKYFTEVANTGFFIDYDKGECYFDSPEYIKLLNFFNENNIGLKWSEYTAQSGEMPYTDHTFDILNGKRFVEFESSYNIHWFGSLFTKHRGDYEDKMVVAGFPYNNVENGSFISFGNSYGIMENSPHKEGAWEFLRYFLSDEYNNAPQNYYSFSVMEKHFDRAADMTMDKFITFKSDDNGRIIEGEMEEKEWRYEAYNNEGQLVIDKEIAPFTQEECDYYKNIIKNAKVLRSDVTAGNIIREETMPFFEGECTAEKCAEMIQNRVSLYLSERYQ